MGESESCLQMESTRSRRVVDLLGGARRLVPQAVMAASLAFPEAIVSAGQAGPWTRVDSRPHRGKTPPALWSHCPLSMFPLQARNPSRLLAPTRSRSRSASTAVCRHGLGSRPCGAVASMQPHRRLRTVLTGLKRLPPPRDLTGDSWPGPAG